MRPVRLYRWRKSSSQHGNFGDEITIPILDRIFGIEAVPVGLKQAELLGAGSILDYFVRKFGRPPFWRRVFPSHRLHVWGTGTLLDEDPILWPQKLSFHAVRGPLTAKRAGLSGVTLGDPGILASRLIKNPGLEVAVAVVPHHLDAGRLPDLPPHWRMVHPVQPVDLVLQKLASAELVISSSLHGLIVADSFGIPTVWTALLGGRPKGQPNSTHKFLDYALARGRPFNAPISWVDAMSMSEDKLLGIATRCGRGVEAWQDELIAAFPSELK